MVRLMALRGIVQRFSLVILLLAAFGLMMLAKIDTVLIDTVRNRVTDLLTPFMELIAEPASTIAGVVEDAQELTDLRAENAYLRQENRTLRQFQEIAYRLEAENISLRSLMNYRPDRPHAFLTARVVADNSGAFVRSLGLNVGANNGVASGQTVLGSRGLAGRIVQVGDRSSRVLLLTDLNMRVPVMLERSRERAIVAGDNTAFPRLLYLEDEADVAVGDRLVTSGHGGMYPSGLPVGNVVSIEENEVRVRPIEELDRLELVRIVDFDQGSDAAQFITSLGAVSFGAGGGAAAGSAAGSATGSGAREATPEPLLPGAPLADTVAQTPQPAATAQ